MGIILALFIFQQIPVTYADTTWLMYGGNLENTHFQAMRGAMSIAPIVKWSYVTGSCVESHGAAVADVNGDDTMEVIIGSCDNKVYCLNGVTGGVEWSYTTGNYVRSLAVADVDGDDTTEVIIGSRDNKVYCLNGVDGGVKWSYETGSSVYSSPAIADVDGDDIMEVVVGSENGKVYCLNGVTGLVEWSHATGGSRSPAVADVDGDDTMEVVVGVGKVCCLNGATGLVKWSYDAVVHRGISVADLDMDGKLEVLVPGNPTDLLTCLNGEDSTVLWKKQLARDIHDITIADIDDDGCVELIVGTHGENKIWVLDDVGNSRDCGSCTSVEERREKRELRVKSLEFRVMRKGVYLFTPNAISVDIKLYDVCGRLKQVIYKGVLSKGGHTFIPNINGSGVYFVVLKALGVRKSIKLINLGW